MNKPETLLKSIVVKNNIVFFSRSCLSQWYGGFDGQDSTFSTPDGEYTYNCAEQAMMHAKALLFEDHTIAERIMQTKNPSEQKNLGRLIANFDANVWDDYKFCIVCDINMAKFKQRPEFMEVLDKYPHHIICEAAPWDKIWGIGMSSDEEGVEDVNNWKGQNLLGKALMTVRDHRNSFMDQ